VWNDRKNTEAKRNFTRTQLNVYKIVAVPILTYASENGIMNRSDKRIIKSAEMRFPRPVAEYTLLDQKRTTDISSEFKIFNTTERRKSGREKQLQTYFMNDTRYSRGITKLKSPEDTEELHEP
jgi:hypothetical protein